ncbi:hypothetical protein V8F20_001825 [Naviculisporaceae sp. PSN 640]
MGHALILSFYNINFPKWKQYHATLVDTFKSIQLSVVSGFMDSGNFMWHLEKFLDKRYRRPRLISLESHGGEDHDGLVLSAGSRSSASMKRRQIATVIGKAEVDVLTIVNCCHAGAAYIPKAGNGKNYAKELITLGGWNDWNYGDTLLSPITSSIKKWFQSGGDSKHGLTGEKLYQFMAAAIRHMRQDRIREYNNLIRYLERKKSTSRFPEIRSQVDNEIQKQKEHIEKAKREYTQPIYMKRYVDWDSEELLATLDLSEKEERAWKLAQPFNYPAESPATQYSYSGGKRPPGKPRPSIWDVPVPKIPSPVPNGSQLFFASSLHICTPDLREYVPRNNTSVFDAGQYMYGKAPRFSASKEVNIPSQGKKFRPEKGFASTEISHDRWTAIG